MSAPIKPDNLLTHITAFSDRLDRIERALSLQADPIIRFSTPTNLYSGVGWRDYNGGNDAIWGSPGYWKDSEGVVHLEGMLDKNGANWVGNEVILTLPVGFRPAKQLIFYPLGNGQDWVRIDVKTNGDVLVASWGNRMTNPVQWLTVAGISFREANA